MYMKKIIFLIGVLLAIGCSNSGGNEKTMIVQGNVEGLKKGTIFLQQFDGEKLVNIDSVEAKGSGEFTFKKEILSPEIFYIFLDLGKNQDQTFGDRLAFFGEPTTITINSKHELFDIHAKIEGSESQKLWEEYSKNIRKFNIRNLELLEIQLKSIKEGYQPKADSLAKLIEKNQLRRHLYALNFAITHGDSHVAPYIVLTDVPDTNVKYLDSVYNALTPEITAAKYGKELKEYINKVKEKNQ